MAQDYWRGGWAEMNSLPGTQAARVAQASGNNYGPLNALADILSAYWQKRERDKSIQAVEDYEANFDSQVNPQPTPQLQAPSLLDALRGGKQQEMSLMQPGQFGTDEWAQLNMQPKQKPLSLSQYAKNARGMKSKLMRDLYRKYPLANMQEMAQWIDEITNNKIMGYADQERGGIYDLINRQGLTQEMLPDLFKRADEYNNIMQAVGGPTINLQDLMKSYATKIANMDTGGRIIQQATPASGLPFRNVPVVDDNGNIIGMRPEYVRTVGEVGKSMSPQQIEQIKLARDKMAQDRYNADRTFALKAKQAAVDAARKDREFESNEAYRNWKMANGGNGGGSRSGGKLSQAAAGSANGIKDALAQAMADIKSGAVNDPENHSVRNLHELIEEAIEKGHAQGDDVDNLRNLDYEVNFLFNKSTGNEDEAYRVATYITPEYWKARLGGYGKQPS